MDARSNTGTAAPQIPSLLTDTATICDRLLTLLNHIQSMNDRLHGSQPRDVALKEPGEPASSIRRNVDSIRGLLGKIEDEVQTIDARL